MKIGDLVQKRGRPENDWQAGHLVGLIIAARHGAIDRDYMSYRVQWSGDYGTFWSCIRDIEVINESR